MCKLVCIFLPLKFLYSYITNTTNNNQPIQQQNTQNNQAETRSSCSPEDTFIDNNIHSDSNSIVSYDNECVICFDKKPCVLFANCGHNIICNTCFRSYINSTRKNNKPLICLTCRDPIVKYIYIYYPKDTYFIKSPSFTEKPRFVLPVFEALNNLKVLDNFSQKNSKKILQALNNIDDSYLSKKSEELFIQHMDLIPKILQTQNIFNLIEHVNIENLNHKEKMFHLLSPYFIVSSKSLLSYIFENENDREIFINKFYNIVKRYITYSINLYRQHPVLKTPEDLLKYQQKTDGEITNINIYNYEIGSFDVYVCVITMCHYLFKKLIINI